jgi:CheY-like chemotaxis protein
MRRARIFLVEDNPEIRELTSGFLALEGHEVTTARNGKEALDRLRAGFAPDLMLLDLQMPVLDGWAVLEERMRDPLLARIPVVVLSASGPRPPGVDGFLTKPFDLDVLTRTVDRFCASVALPA